ncbi:MAG: DUF5615 family PIN-like protein [Candidatus Methanofastidiosia archaeon]
MRKKDFKLYADECIEKNFVDHLREKHNFDVKSTSEEDLQGKPDEIILRRANKTRRFLLTYDKKDFFANDKLFPFKSLFGIICLKFHKTQYPCYHLQWLSEHDKQSLIGKKFLVSYDNVSVRYKGEDSKEVKEILDVGDCLLCKLDETK